MAQVIESFVYIAPSGARFSPYTAWTPEGSVLTPQGWTIRWNDGTTGIGQRPFATKEAAQAYLDAHPNFPGMSQG